MIKINLLPVREERRKLGVRQERTLFILILVLTLIGIFYWHSGTSKKIKNLRQQVAQVDQDIDRLSKIVKEVEQYKKDKKVLENKIEVIDLLKSSRQGPVHYLDEINKALPNQLWLVYFEERDGRVTLRGKSLSTEDIANFMRNLDASDYFQDVELEVTTQQEVKMGQKSVKVNDFTIRCKTAAKTDRA